MKNYSVKELKSVANLIRQDIIRMIHRAGSGHPGGALGMADIFTVLYFKILKHNHEKPNWEQRDRLILSNGHICPVLYATLAHRGYFALSILKKLRRINSPLQGHPHNQTLAGIENSSGPLGQGISIAVGMALAAQLNKQSAKSEVGENHIFCITSDGEHNEGQVWEAIMTANKYKLGNLINIVDYNGIQIDGKTKDIMPLGNLKNKYLSFGWKVLEVNGHNYTQIINTLNKAKEYRQSPVVIIAKTIPGKNVKFMENKFSWHGKAPNDKEAETALEQLKNLC
ncbi:transketolase [bacterium]|nr:transketolase [bacterium]